MIRVGVLALQGAFVEHEDVLEGLGANVFEIRRRSDLDEGIDALVFPGGESTVMGKLAHELGLFGPLRDAILGGLPVLGTCAGMIMLAQDVDGGVPLFATMPVSVRRNAYGRQLGSFSARAGFVGREIPLEFIRAPMITWVGEGVETLCRLDGVPVAVRYGNQVACAFHPELTGDATVHRYFLDLVRPEGWTRA